LDHFTEQLLIEQILPPDIYDKVVRLKEGRPFRDSDAFDVASVLQQNEKDKAEEKILDETYEELIANMKKYHSAEETNAILDMIRREKDEVLKILDREGGDVDEVIARVRAETRAKQKEELTRLIELENKKESGGEVLSVNEDKGISSDASDEEPFKK
jgi:siroheme synthase